MKKRKECVRAESQGKKPRVGLPAGITPESVGGQDVEIHKIETSKDLILQPELARDERKIMPHLGASVVINGCSGSGKTTLLTNYITGPQFFGKCKEKPQGWFDKTFLFSPTGDGDDVQKRLGIPKDHVYTDLDEGPELLRVILDSQKDKLSGGGKAHKVPQYCVIFDDVIGETSFMHTKEFLQTFYMVRHRNCTTFICSQHYKKVPKVCRQQASFVHFFAGSAAEVDTIVEDFAPPLYTRNEFRDLVNYATMGDHAFLTICMKVGWEFRFRRNLGEFLKLDRLSAPEEKKEPGKEDKNEDNDERSKNGKGKKEKESQISADSVNEFHRNLGKLVKYFKGKHEYYEQASKGLRQRKE